MIDVIHNRRVKNLRLLENIAANIEPVQGCRVAASVVYKDEVVAFGFNTRKTHPLQKKFQTTSEQIYLHAEICAIKNALLKISVQELTRCHLYVCRVKYRCDRKGGVYWGMSKPCRGCQRCINTFGLQGVVYTMDSFPYNGQGYNIFQNYYGVS